VELATRADLLDRALVINLPVIPDDKRQPEEKFWSAFEEAWPRLLGALLDGVAGALRELSAVELDRSPRMADFARWATAAEGSFGWPDGAFQDAYWRNIGGATEIALDAEIIMPYLRKLMQSTTVWPKEGETKTADDLLHELTALAGGSHAVKNLAGWPKRGRDLAYRLRRLSTVLRRTGLTVSFLPRETAGMRRTPLCIHRDGTNRE
jgi:hypothetical protein